MSNALTVQDQHYVYLYLDAATQWPVYVGYGGALSRAEQHPGSSHNDLFRAWLAEHPYTIRVCGPFASEQEARGAEKAVIGATGPIFNRQGLDAFRTLGVPAQYAARLTESALSLDELAERCATGVLVVYTTGRVSDGRAPLDLTQPVDAAIRAHAERWWALDRWVSTWSAQPETAPSTLVAVTGPPANRYVLASAPIDVTTWRDHPAVLRAQYRSAAGLWQVPLVPSAGLDARGLRGRRVTDAKFTRLRSGLFHVLPHYQSGRAETEQE